MTDRLIEPSLTGISYSFTADGHYEEAYYRALANRMLALPLMAISRILIIVVATDPSCPQGLMQWQHGTYTANANGSLTLTPFGVDGRQLSSTPCQYTNSLYTRYDQAELLKTWRVYTDPYHNVKRLDLEEFDGTPMNPMFLAYNPPQMLPTSTLNPTPTATASRKDRVKRDLDSSDEDFQPMNKNAIINPVASYSIDAVWWTGLTLTVFGGGLFYVYS